MPDTWRPDDEDAPTALDTLSQTDSAEEAAELGEGGLPVRIGRFAIIRELGRGGMGVVYEAEQSLPQRRVALKTLPPWNRSASAHELFRNEVQALALVLHPGIPQVYEVFEDHGTPVMAMELVEGPGLIEAAAAMSLRQRAGLLARVARAAQHAHGRGIIHRDLKPQNILVDLTGQPKVLDFGIAALVGGHGRSSGTVSYMPPEQFLGGEPDVRSDVYSLGATGWELFLGSPPLTLDDMDTEAIQAAKQTAELSAPELPRPLAAVLIKALAPDPEDRYPTAAAFAADLERYRSDWPVEALAGAPEAWAAAHARRLWRRVVVVAGAMALAVVLVIAGLSLRMQRAQAAVEARAGAELSAIRDSAARLGAHDPAVAAAFGAFTSAPEHDGTAALSEGWLWWGQRAGAEAARRDLAAAWLTAPDDATEQAALTALAPLLAAEERWGAVAAVLERLPDDALTDLRFQEAVIRRRFDEAAAYSHDAAPLLRLLQSARQDPERYPTGELLAGGERFAYQNARMLLVGADGASRWSAEVAERILDPFVRGDEVWFMQYRDGSSTILRQTLGADTPPVSVEKVRGRSRDIAVVDTDGDGVPERYVQEYRPNRLLRAEPPEAPSVAFEHLSAGANAVPMKLYWHETGSATGTLLAANAGWGDHDLRALIAADDGLVVASRYRLLTNDVDTLRDPDGRPRLVVLGNAVGSRPQGDNPYGEVLVIVDWEDGRLTPASEPMAFGIPLRSVRVADLDGDGLEDLSIRRRGASGTLLLRQLPDGDFAQLYLDGLNVVAAGDVGGGPGLWLDDGERSWLAGVEGGAPLPPPAVAPRPAPGAVPAGIAGSLRQRWERAEALASLGLAPDAAALLAALADRPGAGVKALARAIALVPETPEAAEYARALLAREGVTLTEAQRLLALATLWEAYDIDSLRQIAPEALPGALQSAAEVHGEGGLHPAWQVLDPSVVRYDLNSGELEVSVVNGRGPALALPLDWDGEAIDVQLDIDLLEHDWGNQLQIAVETRGGDGEPWSAGVVLHRGGGGAPETHQLGIRCSDEQSVSPLSNAPVVLGERQLRLTWVAESGSLRCAADGGRVSRLPRTPPPGGEARLVFSDSSRGDIPGLVRFRLKRLHIAGATPREAPGYEVNTAFIQGDLAAAAELGANGTPLQRALASVPFRAPGPEAIVGVPADDVALLLRIDPAHWAAAVHEVVGASFAEVWRGLWESPLSYGISEAREAVMLPTLAALSPEDEGAHQLIYWRAQALMDSGRALEASALLAQLRGAAGDEVHKAWYLTARLRVMRGDIDGAREAVAAYLTVSPDPARALDTLLDDERLSGLVPPEHRAAPVLTLEDVRAAHERR